MTITKIFSHLVPALPESGEVPDLKGAEIKVRTGTLFSMLSSVYERAKDECRTPIRFATEGEQVNPCRSELVATLESGTIDAAAALATRLCAVTTGRSGLGLLFQIVGETGGTRKIVLSRFPADEGVIAEAAGDQLSLEFVEKVFMKNARAYKAALYEGTSLQRGFWDGLVVDKQIAGAAGAVATYWIKQFLLSDFKMTGATGSRTLAEALRKAAARTDLPLPVKTEVASMANLVGNLAGQAISVNQVVHQFQLSGAARDAILKALPNSAVAASVFSLDIDEFRRRAPFRVVEIDNGALLTAPADRFEEVFDRVVSDDGVTFSTTGVVVDEKLRARSS